MAPIRTPGIPGKRPPKRAAAWGLRYLLSGTVPDHPASEDYLAALGGGWQLLGNQSAGDCVAVTWANIRRLVTSTLTATPSYPSQDQVWALYKTQNPDFDPNGDPGVNGPGSPADGGMDIQTVLESLVKDGGPDGVKAIGFAAVDHTNPDEVKAAIAIFGYVWTGVQVLDVNTQQFRNGQPWDYDPSSPVDGGHSVITAGYGAPGTGALGGDERFITWAQETSFTDAFWSADVDECWAVIWPEHLGSRAFLEGINQEQLAADYEAITGQPLPVPVQPPAPAPSPAPAPAPPQPAPESLLAELAGLVRQVAASADRELAEVVAWIHAHGL